MRIYCTQELESGGRQYPRFGTSREFHQVRPSQDRTNQRNGRYEMKKFLLGTVGLIALGMAPASAADLAARPYTKAPPMISPMYDWSGFYLGVNGGWGNQRNCFTSVAPFTLGAEGCHDTD